MMDAVYCYLCDQMVGVNIIKEKEVHTIKGIDVCCEVQNPYCQFCGNKVYIPIINDQNLDVIDRTYREQNGVITKEEIEELLKQYDIGAKPLATLLGWGEVTITRYQRGQLPSRAHSDTLKSLRDACVFRSLFEKNQVKLTDIAKKKVIRALNVLTDGLLLTGNKADSRYKTLMDTYSRQQPNEFNGFAVFNLEKLVQVILYFAARERCIYKTKMNKLLWYADMLNYKRTERTALTGLSYKHNYYGPTPMWHDFLYGSLQDIYIKLIDDENGTYIEPLESYSHGILSEEEQEVLDTVLNMFNNWSAQHISEYSHQEKAYKENSHNDFISFVYADYLSLN